MTHVSQPQNHPLSSHQTNDSKEAEFIAAIRMLAQKISVDSSSLAQETESALELFNLHDLEPLALNVRKATLVLLDLCMIEAALVNSKNENLPEVLVQATNFFSETTNHPPTLTYETIVLTNPADEPRRFTSKEYEAQEALFYDSHTKIEVAAHQGLEALFQAHHLVSQGEFFCQKTVINHLDQALVSFQEVNRVNHYLYDNFSEKAFDEMRPYFMGNAARNTPGPSGLYSAAFPTFDRLVMGKARKNVDLKRDFYPTGRSHDHSIATIEQMDEALHLMEETGSLQALSGNLPEAIKQALNLVIDEVKQFRLKHKDLILKFIPKMGSMDKGSGGMENPLEGVQAAIDNMSTAPEKNESNGPTVERIDLVPGYSISRVVRGGWQLSTGHSKAIESKVALKGLMQAFETGITTFDCADIYTGVESLYGRFIQQVADLHGQQAADKIQIHTKFVPNKSDLAQLDSQKVADIIHRSLQRLGVNRLNLVQFHWWDYEVGKMLETAHALKDLQANGDIEQIGLTNFNTASTAQILEAGIPIVSTQVQYSLLDRRPEINLIPLCEQYGIKLLCYGTVAGGFLSEKWLDQPDPGCTPKALAKFENRSLIKYRLIIEEVGGWECFQELLKTLSTLASKHGVTISTISSAMMLKQDQVAGVIVGARNSDHTHENSRITEVEFDASDHELLLRALGNQKLISGDVFDLERDPNSLHARIMKTDLNI